MVIRAITTITTVAIIITIIIITNLVIKEEGVQEEEGITTTKVEDVLIKIPNIPKEMTKVKIIIRTRKKNFLKSKDNGGRTRNNRGQ